MYITANHYYTPVGANNPLIKCSVHTNTTNCDCGNSLYLQILRGRDGTPGKDGRDGKNGQRGLPGSRGPQGPMGPIAGGVVYTRWGRTICPQNKGTQLLYSGRTAGTPTLPSMVKELTNYVCLIILNI